MKMLLTIFLSAITLHISAQEVAGPLGEIFSYRVVADKLSDPWEITWGPDDNLWVTEARGYRFSLINPADGSKSVILDLTNTKEYDRYKNSPQGGLMGMAIHPKLSLGKPYVYFAYINQNLGSLKNDSGSFYRSKIVRYTVNFSNRTLQNPTTLCDTIPGSNDHNGGRLLIAPISGIYYLFYSVGDMGAGQFNNGGRPNYAQFKEKYEGKILRFNLEPDKDSAAADQWIPNNNPFNSISKQSAVFTTGHRNPQGLAFAIIGGKQRIYEVEHGPFSDDEINIIESKRNYGHPLVVGYADGNYNGLAAAATSNTKLPGPWFTSCPVITNESTNAKNIGSLFKAPIKSLYPSGNTFLTDILNAVKNKNTTIGYPNGSSSTWESEAPSSIDVYTSDAIPQWKNSLLITTLKGGKLIRLRLDSTGASIVGDTLSYFKSKNRYRDIAISKDGTKIYLAVDSSSVSSGPSADNIVVSTNRGSILEFKFIGYSSSRPQTPVVKYISTVYPNPAAETIAINFEAAYPRKTVYSVTDVSGRILSSGYVLNSKKFHVDIASFPVGTFIIHLVDEEAKNIGIHRFSRQ